MSVFMANDDANNANLGLHGLFSLLFIMPAMEMVKSQDQNVHIWNPIVDTFMIFTSKYVLASLSVMKTRTGLETRLF